MSRIILQILFSLRYIIKILLEGGNNPFNKVKISSNRQLIIMANGPSLRQFEKKLKENLARYCDYDFFALNDFVNSDFFTELKPLHYVLSDPMFFLPTRQKERGLKVMYSLTNKVTWKMYFYVRRDYSNSEYLNIIKKNPYIQIVYYHSTNYPNKGISSWRNYFYKIGWGNGEFSTVVLNAIYVGITLKYRDIKLYGVDHTFFNGLCVNDENILCYKYEHSFDDKVVLKPMSYHYDESRDYKDMCYFLNEMLAIFQGHKYMAYYAQYMGVNILNCTECSLIDVYPRLKNKE